MARRSCAERRSIIERYFSDQADEDRTAVFLDEPGLGIGSLERLAEPAEQIGLPARLEPRQQRVRPADPRRIVEPRARSLHRGANAGADHRMARRRHRVALGAGGEQALCGDAQVEIAGDRAVDQPVERGIMETGPPAAQVDGPCGRDRLRLGPVRRQHRRRLGIRHYVRRGTAGQ
jgi:hypothetical protein